MLEENFNSLLWASLFVTGKKDRKKNHCCLLSFLETFPFILKYPIAIPPDLWKLMQFNKVVLFLGPSYFSTEG